MRLGLFHVNGIPVQVLFDSGATRSFVSLALSKRFPESLVMLDCPLEVEIADDRSVRASTVFRDSVLRLFEERYLVYLVPIPLRGNKVIIGMDWLSPNGAVTNCAQQLVRVRTLGGGELVIHGERPQQGLVYVQQRGLGAFYSRVASGTSRMLWILGKQVRRRWMICP